MARPARIDVIGDSASAQRALDQTSVAVAGVDTELKKLAVNAEAAARAMVSASTQRIARLQAEAAAARELSATYVAGSREQAAAAELAARRTASANRLLGVASARAVAGPGALAAAGTVGHGLTTYVTAPAAFIGYEAVKQAVDFNQQMLLLRTQAGDATDSVKELSDQVLQLAKTAPQGPTVLAQGLFHLVSLGLRGADAMSTLKVASIAAGMGIANIEDTTSALGAAVVAGIRGAQDYQQAMATLVATAGVGNMRFGDLAAAVGNVIPSAAAAGVSLKEMGAALAVLTDRGMAADEAATRLRMSLALIQRPSRQATNALADMGVNADALGAMLRQPNGLLTVLETLNSAITRVGVVRGNRDLLAAFGGARSGIGIQTLVQSLDSSVSSYQGKLAQVAEQTQRVGQSTQLYLESPAYKLHAALSTVQADLVKLGQSLTPMVTGFADGIAKIADGFDALPGPIKTDLGVIVALLAVGGPLALAIKGVGTLVGGIATAFRLLGPSAATAAATTEVSMAGIGESAAVAEGEVGALQARLVGLSRMGPIAVAVALQFIPQAKPSPNPNSVSNSHVGRWFAHLPVVGGAFSQANRLSDYLNGVLGLTPPPPGVKASSIPNPFTPNIFGTGSLGLGALNPADPNAFKKAAQAYIATHPGATGAGSITKFVLPYRLQLEQENASLTKSTADDIQSARDIVAYAKAQIDSGHLSHAAMLQALSDEGSALNTLWSAQTKAVKSTAAAAKAAATFTLPLQLQEEIARAGALAALNPNLQGPTSLQIKLAKEAKSAAMAAIDSHTLTMQALIDAWNIVGQQNQVLAQAAGSKGALDTYHAVSTRTLTEGLGLSRAARVDLEQRLAQSAAHRGYVPNQIGSGGGDVHIGTLTLQGIQDAERLFWEIEHIGRSHRQRRGQR